MKASAPDAFIERGAPLMFRFLGGLPFAPLSFARVGVYWFSPYSNLVNLTTLL